MKADTMHSPSDTGRVYLVGAGPGNPELLTLRAVHLLQQTEVIVYDHLVSSAVLDYVSPTAERIYAGKRRNEHTMRQEQINDLLVKLAREGRQVVRLKGGDPFIFGRGGEEMMLHGASPSLPVAVIQDGTIVTQKVVTGTLADMPERVVGQGLRSPSLTIIGDVVKLHGALAWFEPSIAATPI